MACNENTSYNMVTQLTSSSQKTTTLLRHSSETRRCDRNYVCCEYKSVQPMFFWHTAISIQKEDVLALKKSSSKLYKFDGQVVTELFMDPMLAAGWRFMAPQGLFTKRGKYSWMRNPYNVAGIAYSSEFYQKKYFALGVEIKHKKQ